MNNNHSANAGKNFQLTGLNMSVFPINMIKWIFLTFLALILYGCKVFDGQFYTSGTNKLWLYSDSTFEYQDQKGSILSYWSFGRFKFLPPAQILLESSVNIDSLSINVIEKVSQENNYSFKFENDGLRNTIDQEGNYFIVINSELTFPIHYGDVKNITIKEPILNFKILCDYKPDVYNSLNRRIKTKTYIVKNPEANRFIVKTGFLPIYKHYLNFNDTINILFDQNIFWIKQNASYMNINKCKSSEKHLTPGGFRR